jgi:hypothetical protein
VAATLLVTLRQTHTPGEKLCIDYSDNRLGIVNPNTGEIREAELFVATLGASNYTYAEATWTQQLSSLYTHRRHRDRVPPQSGRLETKASIFYGAFSDHPHGRTYGMAIGGIRASFSAYSKIIQSGWSFLRSRRRKWITGVQRFSRFWGAEIQTR